MNASGSRSQILARIRQQQLAAEPLPSEPAVGITFADRERQFADTLQMVGGEAVFLSPGESLVDTVRQLDCLNSAQQVVCTVPGLAVGNLDLALVESPHDLAGVDVAVIAGQFAVAENAAVWVSGQGLRHRVVAFLTQRLVLVVPRSQIVHNMHEAYARLRFDQPGYGVFVSGPSKTADIEQSLVIGAHGSRSLTVVFCD